jgi:hypothetical protein
MLCHSALSLAEKVACRHPYPVYFMALIHEEPHGAADEDLIIEVSKEEAVP